MSEPKSPSMVLKAVLIATLHDAEHMTGITLECERIWVSKQTERTLLVTLDGQLRLLRAHLANQNNPLVAPTHDTTDLALDYKGRKVKLDVFLCGTHVRHIKSRLPLFLRDLWVRWLCSSDETAFAALYQTVCVSSKWSCPDTCIPDMLPAYMAQQDTIPRLRKEDAEKIRAEMRRVLKRDLDVDELVPVYGPEGASFNHLRPLDRVGLSPSTVHGVLTKHKPHWFWVKPVDVLAVNRSAQVPKTWNKERLIFVEEEARLNLQQALRRWLEDAITQSSPKRIDFVDQNFQRSSLSRTGVSSIDLSAASDTIGAALVWNSFRDFPLLRKLLFAGRARHHANGAHRCFSTMGNATTFPVMSLILSCVIAIVEREFITEWREATGTWISLRTGTVFGDDMVVDSMIMPRVLAFLQHLGLKPNAKKTYSGVTFKESCGLDLYKGHDCTPLRVNNVADLPIRDSVARLVTISNAAHAKGLWCLGAYILSVAAKYRDIPVSDYRLSLPGTAVSFSRDERDFTYPVEHYRWSHPLQTNESPLAKGAQNHTEEMDTQVHLSYALRVTRVRQLSDANTASRLARQDRDRTARFMAGFRATPRAA